MKITTLFFFAILLLTATCKKEEKFETKKTGTNIDNKNGNNKNGNNEVGDKTEETNKTLYIGTYTNKGGDGIIAYNFNTQTGELQKLNVAATVDNPTFIAFSHDREYLYSFSNGNFLVYKTNFENNILSLIDSKSTEGSGPCYISSDINENFLFVANYGSGHFSFAKLDDSKNITSVKALKPGTSSSPHAHSLAPGPDGKYVYGADLGSDKIFAFKKVDNEYIVHTGIPLPSGTGPRHFDFSPDGNTMAVVGELNNTITLFTKDDEDCFTIKGSSISTVQPCFTEESYSADIHFSEDGKFLYSSNRCYSKGSSSIAAFSFENGSLKHLQWATRDVEWPRNFAIDPSGKYLLVANQYSNSITVFNRDINTGKLSYLNITNNVSGQPVCLKFK